MMRFSIRAAFGMFAVLVVFTVILLWSLICPISISKTTTMTTKIIDPSNVHAIECDINGQYTVSCLKANQEVYIPFSFLQSYFEVNGRINTNSDRFEWFHSYSKIYRPKAKYEPTGVYMTFENYNVEARDRVKCVSAATGVPVTTQWSSQGYFYPTQIAQFGLSHYSKNLTEPEPRRRLVENGDSVRARWYVPKDCLLKRIDGTVRFWTKSEHHPIYLKLDQVLDLVLSVQVRFTSINQSLCVLLEQRETAERFHLCYVMSADAIWAHGRNIYHGLLMDHKYDNNVTFNIGWLTLTRDLPIDLQKGLILVNRERWSHKIMRSKIRLIQLELRGDVGVDGQWGAIDNVTICTSDHMRQFYDAADYLVRAQNAKTGGWPIPVRRKLQTGFKVIKPGWYSAMAQGHAISVLARAYRHSHGKMQYLRAAISALHLFRVQSEDGGFVAEFFGVLRWYEEYPSQPASFVLNGFIYSLLGLYDLMRILHLQRALSEPMGDDLVGALKEVTLLFGQGVHSLSRMLALYDMGSVSCYDLRHVTLGVAPNLARWDYHAAHINQLLLLATIVDVPDKKDDDETFDGALTEHQANLFRSTAERWIGYMMGKRASHN